MKSCLDLKRQASSLAATCVMVRFLLSVIGLLSMEKISVIIGHSAGDLMLHAQVADKTAGTYGKDTFPRISFSFLATPAEHAKPVLL